METSKLVRIGSVAAMALLLAACGSSGGSKDEMTSDASATSGAQSSGYDAGNNVSASNGKSSAGSMANKASDGSMVQASDLSTVFYFDFDSSVIRSDSTVGLDMLSKYLKQNRSTAIVLGGHADERGTREYNMALGESRAKSVESYLLLQGVYRKQLEAVSYGEEKPLMDGHDEQSRSKNRRVEAKL